jgi:tetratricopeptide (TPR) repeat protein
VHREHLGEQSIDVALGTAKLGRILMEQGRLDAAGPLLEEGLEKIRALHDPPHPYTAQSQVHLGRLRLRQGRLDDAERRFAVARRQTEQVFPEGHPNRSGPLFGLARVRLARGDAGGAEPLLRETLSLRRTAFGPDHWGVAWAQSVLGHCLAEQGRTDAAARRLASGIETLRSTRPDGDRYLRQAEAYRARLPAGPG